MNVHVKLKIINFITKIQGQTNKQIVQVKLNSAIKLERLF